MDPVIITGLLAPLAAVAVVEKVLGLLRDRDVMGVVRWMLHACIMVLGFLMIAFMMNLMVMPALFCVAFLALAFVVLRMARAQPPARETPARETSYFEKV